MADNQNSRALDQHEVKNTVPTPTESAPTDVRGTADVFVAQAEVVGQVADVIGTVESSESSEDAEGGEGFGEGEQSGKGKQSSGKAQQSTQPTTSGTTPLPPPTLMRKQIIQEIRKEIRTEEKKIMAAYFGLSSLPPDKLQEILVKIRQLKDILASIIDATGDLLKTMYEKWVKKN